MFLQVIQKTRLLPIRTLFPRKNLRGTYKDLYAGLRNRRQYEYYLCSSPYVPVHINFFLNKILFRSISTDWIEFLRTCIFLYMKKRYFIVITVKYLGNRFPLQKGIFGHFCSSEFPQICRNVSGTGCLFFLLVFF
jgi:hypothetical protein